MHDPGNDHDLWNSPHIPAFADICVRIALMAWRCWRGHFLPSVGVRSVRPGERMHDPLPHAGMDRQAPESITTTSDSAFETRAVDERSSRNVPVV
jgi:hypothetical protein